MSSPADVASARPPQPGPQAFTELWIRVAAPMASGVYRIYDDLGVLLLVGESSDIQGRLLDHLDDPALRRYQPHQFEYDLMPESDRIVEEARQIRVKRPVLNLIRPSV